MPAPPPPPPPALSLSAAGPGDQDRSLLLQSIRAGKSLKKTVTVDKSGPAVSGKVKGEAGSRESNGPVSLSSVGSNNGAPMGLGGLFSSGMPKLKPTGLRNTGDRDASSVNSSNATHTTHSIKRGPPPVPPPATQKPQVFPQAQSTTDSPSNAPEVHKSYGKPVVAPKPPQTPSMSQKPSPPPKKLNLTTGGSVSRAQSMRLPRSPPVLAPTPPSLHQSQDCLNEVQPRPASRPLRPPVVKPPSPPTSRNSSTTATRAAPPPPSRVTVTAPCMPPPPPPLPHRPAPVHQRLAPPPPPPPTPPTRTSSMRNGQPTNQVDLDVRFADSFHSIAVFPTPEPFKGFPKVYSSRNAAKQQAPAPPSQGHTMVPINTSSGG